MRTFLFAFILICLSASNAFADYNKATIKAVDPSQSAPGSYRLIVVFEGDKGEEVIVRETMVSGAATLLSVRQWAISQVTELNSAKALKDKSEIQPGQTLDLSPIVKPLSASEVWQRKAFKLLRAKSLGLTNSDAVNDTDALEKDVNNTYVSGYLDQF